jgi:2-polyprenyl-3-methyl-5-hydroxy-6-metoxy-1,4-benzoquinol methylase
MGLATRFDGYRDAGGKPYIMVDSTAEQLVSDTHYRTKAEYERSSKQFMRAMVRSNTPLRILDVGCGTGLNAALLAEQGHDVYGIDLSPVAIEKFRAKALQGSVINIETGPIPLPADSFDLIYASEVIEHCVDTVSFLRNLRTVLKPGGMLLLSTPNSAFWAYRLMALVGLTVGEFQHPGHVRFFSCQSLSAAIKKAGFDVTALSARHMYLILGRRLGDAVAPLLRAVGFQQEPRFATGDHFWQISAFAPRASGFWADTLIVAALKTIDEPSERAAGPIDDNRAADVRQASTS